MIESTLSSSVWPRWSPDISAVVQIATVTQTRRKPGAQLPAPSERARRRRSNGPAYFAVTVFGFQQVGWTFSSPINSFLWKPCTGLLMNRCSVLVQGITWVGAPVEKQVTLTPKWPLLCSSCTLITLSALCQSSFLHSILLLQIHTSTLLVFHPNGFH